MKASKFSDAQKAFILKQSEVAKTAVKAAICSVHVERQQRAVREALALNPSGLLTALADTAPPTPPA